MRRLSAVGLIGLSVLLEGYCGAIAAQDVSSTQRRVDLYGDALPEHALARLGTVRLLPSSSIWAIAISPDGKTVASGTIPGSVRNQVELWDTVTGKRLGVLVDGTVNILGLAWSPDGRHLAIAHANRAEIWDPLAGNRIGELEATDAEKKADGVWSLGWSRDARWIAGYHPQMGRVLVWDAATRRIARSAHFSQALRGVAFSADSRFLAVCGEGLLQVREVSSFDVKMDKKDLNSQVYSVAFSPDERTLAGSVAVPAPDEEKLCRILFWDTTTGEPRGETVAFGGVYVELAYVAGGRLLAAGTWGRDEGVRFWDTVTRKESARTAEPAGRFISVSTDGKKLATGNRRVVLYDTTTAKRLHDWDGYPNHGHAIRFSTDAKTIISGSTGGVYSWDWRTGRRTRRPLEPDTHVFNCAFSHDGKLIASAKRDDTAVYLRDLASGGLLGKMIGHKGVGNLAVSAFDFSPDDRSLASGGCDGAVCLWDVAKQALTQEYQLPGPVARVRFSPDGKALGCGIVGQNAHIILLAGGKDMGPIAESAGLFFGPLDFAPNGPVVAIPGIDRNAPLKNSNGLPNDQRSLVRLWDYQARKQTWASEAVSYLCCYCIAVSHHGKLVAAGGDLDNVVSVWSLEKPNDRMKLRGHCDAVRALAFSPDDRQLVSAGQDGNLIVWDVTPLQAQDKSQ